MVARAYTVAFEGVEARMVEVQCSVTTGSSAFNLVGLPDKAVSEARERVRIAHALEAIIRAELNRRILAALPKTGVEPWVQAVRQRTIDPYTAAQQLLNANTE